MSTSTGTSSFWLARFDRAGRLAYLERTTRTYASGSSSFLVEAPTRDQALQMVHALRRAYERERVAKSRRQLDEAGRCRCGRDRDHPTYKRCSVCRERQKKANRDWHQRKKTGEKKERDEDQRLEANAERRRERRAELALETLLRVREAWQNAANNGQFTQWLAGEITRALAAGEGKAA